MGEATAMRFLQPSLKRGETGTPFNTFTAGLMGGLVQSVVSVPIEVVKCTMQASESSTVMATKTTNQSSNAIRDTFNCVRDLYRREGLFRGLFKGYFVTVTRDVPSLGVYFFTYKYARDQITRYQQVDTPSHSAIIVGGGLAGAASWCSVYPFDVMKTYCQVTHVEGQPNYRVTILRAFPVNAATFYFYEKITEYLHME
eukprot:gene23600-29835_t